MEFGLFGINMGPLSDPLASSHVAKIAEAAGFDSLWAGEHIVLPDPQVEGSPLPPDYPMLDPNISFAWLAAQTQQIKFGTGIIILPQRNPLVLAKEMASLDVLCGGRLLFGVGIGYLKAEFDALGVSFKDKGPRTVEYLEAMQSIWNEEDPSYDGDFVSFAGVKALPRPLQKGGPPVIFGGHVQGAFERTVSHGHGWYGFGLSPEATAECVQGLEAALARGNRPAHLGKLELSVTPFGNIDLDLAKRYQDLGIERLIALSPTTGGELFNLSATESDISDYVKKLGDEVIARL
ncbi:MAG: LLM class F420-dependent oxidoreductase [Pseudomonadota bacterium]